MAAFNEYQKAAIRAYGGGDFAFVADIEDEAAAMQAVEDQGDTLFRFIVIELGDNEGCDSVEEALSRITNAMRDLQVVESAVEQVEETPAPAV